MWILSIVGKFLEIAGLAIAAIGLIEAWPILQRVCRSGPSRFAGCFRSGGVVVRPSTSALLHPL